jgi:hypothetical protein
LKLKVVRIVRRGKFHTRVETSDGKQLVLENSGGIPEAGQELGIEVPEEPGGVELRPLAKGDRYPGMVGSIYE